MYEPLEHSSSNDKKSPPTEKGVALQKKATNTGLTDPLKGNLGNLSRDAMKEVNVQNNSNTAAQLQVLADNYVDKKFPIQKKNDTGLPDQLKSGIENLSGHSMDDVKVHYNSSKPEQLQAHAYAQGNQIHLAPGQEKHLPHEAWHVVQQKQGRVKPTMQLKSKVNINDDEGLEKEADVMGAKALLKNNQVNSTSYQMKKQLGEDNTVQLVKAYRVEYSHNRKVIDENGKVTGLTAPIDISFVLPDHSEYFASERNQEQLKGLRVVEWDMDDNWWAAVRNLEGHGKDKLNGKAQAYSNTMKGKLAKPSWSDGASITKFIKQTALHFQQDWGPSLNSAIIKGSGKVEDLEAQYYESEKEKLNPTDTVWAYSEATEDNRKESDFDEADFGPENGFEVSKEEAIKNKFDYIPLSFAISRGYKDDE